LPTDAKEKIYPYHERIYAYRERIHAHLEKKKEKIYIF
jgi:hypothetical protein